MNAAALTLPLPHDVGVIDDALNKAPVWRISLPGPLEMEYRQQSVLHRHAQLLRSGWLALLIFNSFLVVDWLMAPDMFWESVLIRLGIFTPVGMLTLWLADRYQKRSFWYLHLDLVDVIVMLSGWSAAACLAWILVNSRAPMSIYYHAGYMVVLIYGMLVQPVRFIWAFLFGVGMLAIHFWSAAHAAFPLPEPLRMSLFHLLACTMTLCLVANHMVEKARRRRFLLLRREQAMVEQLADVHGELLRLSRVDVLTGVANRRHFHEHLQQVWTRAVVDASPVSVLMLDVDHFKVYNDLYGHPAGDACLRTVSAAVEDHLRKPLDFVARYGGEEFVAVLPGASSEVAAQVAERVRAGVQARAIAHEGSSTASVVTVSVGVATAEVPGSSCPDADRLVAWADRALYEAKRGDRNRVKVFEPGQSSGSR